MTPFLPAMFGWLRFGQDLTLMQLSAGEVILRRTMRMAQGQMGTAEWAAMLAEKNTALAASAERAMVSAAGGATAAAIASAALGPYGRKVRANARRLRR